MSDQLKSIKKDPYRPAFHIMPPTGWMNDPNGLCEFKGKYHVFFQYSPDNPCGGQKLWGHYAGDSLVDLRFEGAPLAPDMPFDKNGVYSGCAFIADDEMQLYYTGNVKQPGDHDFTYSGREANTVLVKSRDGEHFSEKEFLMGNDSYPAEYTCHVRDPKVWTEGGSVYMVQGGRIDGGKIGPDTAGKDRGAVIVFKQDSAENTWSVLYSITTEEAFGYMWECPDYFSVDGKKIISCSPQGLPACLHRWQNIYQSGYFVMSDDFDITAPTTLDPCFKGTQAAGMGDYRLIKNPETCFKEWDMGFDFYAPQSFEDSDGRRILIGWAGMPDADYDNQPTVEKGWQHMLTVPRVVSVQDGCVRQWPIEELESLRTNLRETTKSKARTKLSGLNADIVLGDLSADKILKEAGEEKATLVSLEDSFGQFFELTLERWEGEAYILRLLLSERPGRGRKERVAVIAKLSDLRVLTDASIAEIFVNGGETVFTTRFYADEGENAKPFFVMTGPNGAKIWNMKEMKLEI